MPLSRETLDSLVVTLYGSLMRVVSFDTTLTDGVNAIAGTAIATALRGMGLNPVDPIDPSDDDLAGIPAARIGEFLDDRLPLAIHEMIVDNWGAYNERNNTTSQDKGSLLRDILSIIGRRRERIALLDAGIQTISAPVSGVRCDVPPCPCPPPGHRNWTNRWV